MENNYWKSVCILLIVCLTLKQTLSLPTSELLSFHPLNENGENWSEEPNLELTFVNNPIRTLNRFDRWGAYEFRDGDSHYMTTTSHLASVWPSDGLTVSVWYFCTGIPPSGVMAMVSTPGFRLELTSLGEVTLFSNFVNPLSLSCGALCDGEWHHAAATVSPFNGDFVNVTIYRDGGELAEVPNWDAGGAFDLSAGPLQLGAQSGTNFLNASLDEVAIYKRELTDNEIRLIFLNLDAPADALTSYYPMDDALGYDDAWTAGVHLESGATPPSHTYDRFWNPSRAVSFGSDKNLMSGTYTVGSWPYNTKEMAVCVWMRTRAAIPQNYWSFVDGAGFSLMHKTMMWEFENKVFWEIQLQDDMLEYTSFQVEHISPVLLRNYDWHHVCGTISIEPGVNVATAKLYLNNELLVEDTMHGIIGIHHDMHDQIRVSSDSSGTVYDHYGKLDDLIIFNRCISDEEVSMVYHSGIGCMGFPGKTCWCPPGKFLRERRCVDDCGLHYFADVAKRTCVLDLGLVPTDGLLSFYPLDSHCRDVWTSDVHFFCDRDEVQELFTTDRFSNPGSSMGFFGAEYSTFPSPRVDGFEWAWSTDQAQAISISHWFRTNTVPKTRSLVSGGDPTGFDVKILNASTLHFAVYNISGHVLELTQTVASPFDDDAWHHVVGTSWVDAGTLHAELYFDNELITSGSMPASEIHFSEVGLCLFSDDGFDFFYSGYIDDVALYSRKLTHEDVSKLFFNGACARVEDITLCYPCILGEYFYDGACIPIPGNTDGLLAFYPLNNLGGYDVWTSGVHLAAINDPVAVPDRFSVSNSSAYLDQSQPLKQRFQGENRDPALWPWGDRAISISMWISTTEFPANGYACIFGGFSNPSNAGVFVHLRGIASDENLYFKVHVDGTELYYFRPFPFSVNDGNFHHLVVTAEIQSGGDVVLSGYIDNVFIDSEITPGFDQDSPLSYGSDFLVMGKTPTGTSYYDGSIDDVAVYNRSLTHDDVSHLYFDQQGCGQILENLCHPCEVGLLLEDGKCVSSCGILYRENNVTATCELIPCSEVHQACTNCTYGNTNIYSVRETSSQKLKKCFFGFLIFVEQETVNDVNYNSFQSFHLDICYIFFVTN